MGKQKKLDCKCPKGWPIGLRHFITCPVEDRRFQRWLHKMIPIWLTEATDAE